MTQPVAGGHTETRSKRVGIAGHPGALGPFSRILQLCRLGRIDRAYVPRLLAISLTSLLSSPLRLWEQCVYGKRVARTSIHPSPIFIIGHWRSGTTHLQNLICQDEALGYLSAFQAIAPGFCLVGRGTVKRLLARIVEPRNRTRPMDRVPFSLDVPQEEELALANMTAHSFSHAFVLPQHAQTFFDRYVLFENLPKSALSQRMDAYLSLLRKISFACGGKRLALKDCTNTARIPTLLKTFPNAKFIYIHRNPYDVFVSTKHLHRKLNSICQLQGISTAQVERNVLTFYRHLMTKYLADRSLIPSGNLMEVSYEDLGRDPLQELHRIYHGLALPGFTEAEPRIRSYIKAVGNYKKNAYQLDGDAIAKVNENWKFAFDEWQYAQQE